MMKKRVLAFAFALLLLLLSPLAWEVARAEETLVALSAATVEGVSGEEVDVSLTLAECEAVDSLQFHLNYDATALKPVRVTAGSVFPAEYCVTNLAEPGRVRAACASAEGVSAEDSGTLMIITFSVLSGTGSALSFSDVVVTRVDSEYNQTRAYLSVTDGGVTVGGAALPAPVTTPWVAETPVPTPSPTPEPTPEPTPVVFADPTPAPTVTPAPAATDRALLPYLIVGVFAVLATAAIVIILVSGSKTSKRKRKRRKKKKKGATRRG